MTKRYIYIDESKVDVYRILHAIDILGIEHEFYGHDKNISIIEINVGNMWRTYEDAANLGGQFA